MVLLLVLSTPVIVGCGGWSSRPLPGSPAPYGPPVALEPAVRWYTQAFFSGQGNEATKLLSKRCNTPAVRQAIISSAANSSALYGHVHITSITPGIDGDHATVTYRFNQPGIDDENQPWVKEDGAWHYDKC
jgi:hypothetical protein